MALVVWCCLLAAAVLWGHALNESGYRIKLNAPPFVGRYEWRITWRLLVPVGFGAILAALLPPLTRRLPWRALAPFLATVAASWALALALVNGWDSVTNPVARDTEYLAAVPVVESAGAFLSGFTTNIDDYPLHVQGHPPGFVLLLWSLQRLGAGGPGWVAALEIAGGAAMVPAAVVALRGLAGEDAARAAAPFVALAPIAIWVATSADAFFAGVAAWGVALFVLACTSRRREAYGDALAAGAGLLLGFALYLTYGALALGAIVVAVALARGAYRALLVAALGVAAVALAFTAAGFWWPDGVAASIASYEAGVASTRPFAYFAVANIAAFAVALGPAVAAALVELRDRRVWLLVGPALMGVAAANLSGLSKGEVERIWLPFAPWVLVATCALARRWRRGWLTAQVLGAVLVQTGLRTPW